MSIKISNNFIAINFFFEVVIKFIVKCFSILFLVALEFTHVFSTLFAQLMFSNFH